MITPGHQHPKLIFRNHQSCNMSRARLNAHISISALGLCFSADIEICIILFTSWHSFSRPDLPGNYSAMAGERSSTEWSPHGLKIPTIHHLSIHLSINPNINLSIKPLFSSVPLSSCCKPASLPMFFAQVSSSLSCEYHVQAKTRETSWNLHIAPFLQILFLECPLPPKSVECRV